MDFNSEEIGWPNDTVFVNYEGNAKLLIDTVLALASSGFVFIVSAKHQSIAMSRDAAMALSVWRMN